MECKVTKRLTSGFNSVWANTRPQKLHGLVNYSTGKCDLVQTCNLYIVMLRKITSLILVMD